MWTSFPQNALKKGQQRKSSSIYHVPFHHVLNVELKAQYAMDTTIKSCAE